MRRRDGATASVRIIRGGQAVLSGDAVERLMGLTLPPLVRASGASAAVFHTIDARRERAPTCVVHLPDADDAHVEALVTVCVGADGVFGAFAGRQLAAPWSWVEVGAELPRSTGGITAGLLRQFGLRFEAALLLCADGRPAARIVLLRDLDAGLMNGGDVVLLRTARSQIEHAFVCAQHYARAAHRSFPAGGLTRREHEVVRVALSGASNAEIAAALCLTEATVKTHLCHIFRKLGVRSRAQLLSLAASLPTDDPRPPGDDAGPSPAPAAWATTKG